MGDEGLSDRSQGAADLTEADADVIPIRRGHTFVRLVSMKGARGIQANRLLQTGVAQSLGVCAVANNPQRKSLSRSAQCNKIDHAKSGLGIRLHVRPTNRRHTCRVQCGWSLGVAAP
jgi:hypothetical protein